MKKYLFILFLFQPLAYADLNTAQALYLQRGANRERLHMMAKELMAAGFHYAAIPWIKEYMAISGKSMSSGSEKTLEEMIRVVGVKQFEVLSNRILDNSRSSAMRFILGKKLFSKNQFQKSYTALSQVAYTSSLFPFAAHMKGSINSIMGQHQSALKDFEDCIDYSNTWIGRYKDFRKQRQLKTNRDYCIAGRSRTYFANKKYAAADLQYLDIEKDAFIWPEILFEEAWNSYYMGNYNRVLGKLVTYKAPVLNFVFKPEAEVLTALSYLKLCLYTDATKVIDEFYRRHKNSTRAIRRLLGKRSRSLSTFWEVMDNFEKRTVTSNQVLNDMLLSISREPAYHEIKSSLEEALKEQRSIVNSARSQFGNALTVNIREVVSAQKKIAGAYVKKRIGDFLEEIELAFSGLSYIKLEILRNRKNQLYAANTASDSGKRGDIRYITRNDKQYFWTFNGEFWADELGDYVFALPNMCRK